MANMMQCRTSFTEACYANINIAQKHSPIRCFNGLIRSNSRSKLTSTERKTFSLGKSAHMSTITCCQSTKSSTTIERVQDIIAHQLSVDVATVQPQTKFSDLGADSLDTVEIVMSIEEEFGVSIPENSAENISTVQQVADLIEQQIKVTV